MARSNADDSPRGRVFWDNQERIWLGIHHEQKTSGESVVAGCERNAPRASFKNAAVNKVTMKELRTRVAARLDVLSCVISFEPVVRHNDILRCGGRGRCM